VVVVSAVAVTGYIILSRPQVPAFARTPDQNILLVTIDTLRADALGVYGGAARTPNLDALASRGLMFTSAHAHAVTTLPSHASILTGLFPTQHAVHDNDGFRLAPSVSTLASRLKAASFSTAAFVGAFPLDSRFGLTTGFDLYDDAYPGTSGGRDFVLPERRADAVVGAANRWLGAQTGRWFAWVHVFDPHAPYRPPAPFDREYAASPYLGEVAYTDSALAALISAAMAASGGRPTLVIVTGDHGEGLGDHGEQTHGLFAYEATLRVPLIVAQIDGGDTQWKVPAGATPSPGGHAIAAPVCHADVVPTVLDALAMPAASELPGRSVLAAGNRRADEVTVSYFEALSPSLSRGWAPLRGVVAGSDKYIDLPIQEVYDLATDPREASNLADRMPERARKLDAALRAVPASFASPGARVADAEASERLRALGYVTGRAAAKPLYTEADDPKRLVGVDQDLHRAIDLYQRGRAADAVPIYQGVIATHPGMESAYTHLAMVQWELDDRAAAITTLRSAIAAGITSVTVQTKLGIYLAESGHAQDAVALLRDAGAGEFPDLDALNALGIALANAGQADEAAEIFTRILQFSPANAMALENLGALALARQDYASARGFFTRALERDSSSAQSRNGLGVVELKAGNRRAAIEHWRAAVSSNSANFYALYNLGVELVNDGKPLAARPYLERFAATAPPGEYANDIQHVRALLLKLPR
jgi:arylsulfatase A-like enzyme/Flp pilus assembly protein TadD